MSLIDFLKNLQQLNITVALQDGKVKVFDPDSNLSDVLLAELKNNKVEIEKWLKEGQGYTESDFPYSNISNAELQLIQQVNPELQNIYIATPMQTGLIFHGLMDGTGASYTTQQSTELIGFLDVDAFRNAWIKIVSRYDILRTSFEISDNKKIHQLVHKNAALPFVFEDWSDYQEIDKAEKLRKFMLEDKSKGFDFSCAPLMRVTIIKLSERIHHCIWTHHHVLLDGWCQPILFGELIKLYSLISQGEDVSNWREPFQFERYIAWLDKKSQEINSEIFWKQHLAGFESPTPLVVDQRQNHLMADDTFQEAVEIPTAELALLRRVANQSRCTLNTLLQLAWAYLLYRYSGRRDIIFGATISGRPSDLDGVEEIIGLFINTIPVRVLIDPDASVSEMLSRIQKNNISREEHGYFSLADIQKCAGIAGGSVLFDSLVVFENYPDVSDNFNSEEGKKIALRLGEIKSKSETNYAITIRAKIVENKLLLEFCYKSRRFSQAAIDGIKSHLCEILRAISSVDISNPVSSLNYMGKIELRKVLHEWNSSKQDLYPTDSIHSLFQDQVRIAPDAMAVVYEGNSLTYRGLNEGASKFANYLTTLGVKKNDLVLVQLSSSLEVMTVLLGILKVGAAYIPLDSSYPAKRVHAVMDDSKSKYVITHSKFLEIYKDTSDDVSVVNIGTVATNNYFSGIPLDEYSSTFDAVNGYLAYIIYTSGSTGIPKGVMVGHQSVCNFIKAGVKQFLHDEIVGAVVSTSIAFDATVQSLFVPLISGLYVEFIADDKPLFDVLESRLFNSENALLFKMTPSHLRGVQGVLQNVKANEIKHVIVLGGEKLFKSDIKSWKEKYLPQASFINEYGPTEATVGTCIFPITQSYISTESSESILIGKPLQNIQCYILNENLEVQPSMTTGELYIAGDCLAIGYLNREDYNREKFINVDIPLVGPTRLYRTGDLVRWTACGNLDFVGRLDNQVKIRGYRIELGEIEAAVRKFDDVKDVIVLNNKIDAKTDQLIAHVVVNYALDEDELLRTAQEEVLCDSLSTYLQTILPDYMIPSVFNFLNDFPLTTNGKIDVSALTQIELDVQNNTFYVAPSTNMERYLCDLWQSLLNIDRIGVADNFFSLGGDSIISIQIASRASKDGYHFGVRDIFESKNIENLAKVVKKSRKFSISQDAVIGETFLLPIQLAFFEREYPVRNHYNQAIVLSTSSQIDADFLNRSVNVLVSAHDALRLSFLKRDNSYIGIFNGIESFDTSACVQIFDLGGYSEEVVAATITEKCNLAQSSLDLEQGNLFRFIYFSLGNGKGKLMITVHHLVVDGVSWRILVNDLEDLWQQHQDGKTFSLSRKSSSIKDWAIALRNYIQHDDYIRERDYWIKSAQKPLPELLSDNTDGGYSNDSFTLTADLADQLIGVCNDAFSTQINELLLAALLMAYSKWLGSDLMGVDIEGHGREELFEDIDLTNSIGWFTAIYPLVLSSQGYSDIGQFINGIKEQYREVPNNGVGYGIVKYIDKDTAFREADNLQFNRRIKFNYLGQFDQGISSENRNFQLSDDAPGQCIHPDNVAIAPLIVVARVEKNNFMVDMFCSENVKNIKQFSHLYKTALLDVVEYCVGINTKKRLQREGNIFSAHESELESYGIEV